MNKKELIILCLTLAFSLNLNIARSQPVLEVEGIIKDNKTKPYALVNGRIVNEGEEVDGAKIIEVKDDSVKFQYEGNIIVKKIGEKSGGEVKVGEVKGAEKQRKNIALESFETSMRSIQRNKDIEKLQQEQSSLNRKIDGERQTSEYIDATDEYWKAARIYASNNQYDEAIESYRKSIDSANQALLGIADEAYKTRIRAIIDSRERALQGVVRAKELARQNQFKPGRGN